MVQLYGAVEFCELFFEQLEIGIDEAELQGDRLFQLLVCCSSGTENNIKIKEIYTGMGKFRKKSSSVRNLQNNLAMNGSVVGTLFVHMTKSKRTLATRKTVDFLDS